MTTSTFLQRLVRQLRQTADARPSDRSSDTELLQRFQQHRDPDALETIVRRYGSRVLSACRKVLAGEADVEDAFQATFVILFQHAHSIRQGQALGGWLSCVAHRVALKALANATRRQRVEQCQRPAASETPDLSWREACAILHEELDQLPDQYRLPLILCYLEGMSRDEAAQQLGVTTDTLRGRLARGRDQLRKRLMKRGITLSVGLLGVAANSVRAARLPEHLLRATLEAVVSGRIPAKVAVLLHGATPSLTAGKFKLAAVAVLVVGLISGGVGLSMHGTAPTAELLAQQPPPSTKKAEKEAPEKGNTPDADNKPVAVSGKVIGPDGKPVPKAKLFVFDSEERKPAPQLEANADGAFTFELPSIAGQATYRYLVATAPDLGLGCDWVGVPAATEGKPVVGAKIRVTAMETGKDDTLDEFVRLWTKDFWQQDEALRTLWGKQLRAKKALAEHFAAITDTDGRFTLNGIGRNRCPQLTVTAKGKATQLCFVPLRPDYKPAQGGSMGTCAFGPEFTLILTTSTPITGVVHDTEKKPLAGVTILGQVDLNDTVLHGPILLPDVEAVTDAEGRYTLDGLPKGTKYILGARPKRGSGTVHGYVMLRDDKPETTAMTADFELPRGVVVTGQLKDKKTGKPVRAYILYRPLASNDWEDKYPIYSSPKVSPGLAPWVSDTETWSDAEGRFKLTAVPGPGMLQVQVFDGDFATAQLAPEDDTEEIVEKTGRDAGTFNVRGTGGHVRAISLNAYRVLRIPADAKTLNVELTVEANVPRAKE
jgi:RNA polymerase sigma factor (sigma-70 family)